LHPHLGEGIALATYQSETEGMTSEERRAILRRVRQVLASEEVGNRIQAAAERARAKTEEGRDG
jgi:hypothetical protein